MRWIALQACLHESSGMRQAAAQQAMASVALGFTPRVALLDDTVLLEVSGSLRLFAGQTRLDELLKQRLTLFFESNSLPASVNIAQGATSLIAVGRLRTLQYRPEVARQRVADLPISSLTAARPHLGVLERMGCRTWDDLLRLPRDGVARRFGADLLEALDRARGGVPDGYEWLVLPEQFDEKLELDALVTHAPALMTGVGQLLVQLHAWLLGRQSGLCALKLIWLLDKRRDVPPTGELVIRTAQPAHDLRHVARLIAERLGQQRLAAPVHSLRLQSLETEKRMDAASATASLLMEARQQGDSAQQLIERLSARLGESQVQTWQPHADHRPEQMQRWVSALTKPGRHQEISSSGTSAAESIAARPNVTRAKGRKSISHRQETRAEALYPTWLLPEPLKLAMVGNRPVYQGRLQRLAGPQRLEATGWLMAGDTPGGIDARVKPPAMRDYFIYGSEQGSLLWIYSERLALLTPGSTPRRDWYLHGFFA